MEVSEIITTRSVGRETLMPAVDSYRWSSPETSIGSDRRTVWDFGSVDAPLVNGTTPCVQRRSRVFHSRKATNQFNRGCTVSNLLIVTGHGSYDALLGGVLGAHVCGTGDIGEVVVTGAGEEVLDSSGIATAVTAVQDWIDAQFKTWSKHVNHHGLSDGKQDVSLGTAAIGAAARLRVDRLARVQSVLGVSTQTLAAILGITRQNLYKWLDATKEITLQDASRERLSAVERLATKWQTRTNNPIASVEFEPLHAGGSLHDLLVADELDEPLIISVFDELVDKLSAKPKTLSKRMAEAGFKRRSSARLLPSED
jgi:hypothetical protein